MAQVAAALGKPFMPWQKYVADVALELDPETGRLCYSEVGLTVPRQSGKSTWILAKATHRASATEFYGPRQRIVYTAQTRQKAREKWEEDYAADLLYSPVMAGRVVVHKGNGNEHVRFTNGSRFGIEANTEKAGHGGTIDEAYLDEAFSQVDGRLEQAFRPAMITRRNTQLIWVSTAGWKDASPYLEGKVARGREAVARGLDTGLAYFEWSADPEADPDDPETYWECMPALGHTIDVEAIKAERAAMPDADFRRAYLNQWVSKLSGDASVIDPAAWGALTDPRSAIAGGRLAFAVDVTPDRQWSAISVAGERLDGLVHLESIEHKRDTRWVPERLAELSKRWGALAVVIDPGSAAGSLIPAVQALGVDVTMTTARDYAQACGQLYDAVVSGEVRHLDQRPLTAAVVGAKKRTLGDAWAWNRRTPTVDITPLVSATLAMWGVRTAEDPVDIAGSVW